MSKDDYKSLKDDDKSLKYNLVSFSKSRRLSIKTREKTLEFPADLDLLEKLLRQREEAKNAKFKGYLDYEITNLTEVALSVLGCQKGDAAIEEIEFLNAAISGKTRNQVQDIPSSQFKRLLLKESFAMDLKTITKHILLAPVDEAKQDSLCKLKLLLLELQILSPPDLDVKAEFKIVARFPELWVAKLCVKLLLLQNNYCSDYDQLLKSAIISLANTHGNKMDVLNMFLSFLSSKWFSKYPDTKSSFASDSQISSALIKEISDISSIVKENPGDMKKSHWLVLQSCCQVLFLLDPSTSSEIKESVLNSSYILLDILEFVQELENDIQKIVILSPSLVFSLMNFLYTKIKQSDKFGSKLGLFLWLFTKICSKEYAEEYSQQSSRNVNLVFKAINSIISSSPECLQETNLQCYEKFAPSFADYLSLRSSIFDDELYSVTLLLLKFLSCKKSATLLADAGVLDSLTNLDMAERIFNAEQNAEQKISRLIIECIVTGSKDSAIRFKIKNKAVSFFLHLFKKSTDTFVSSDYMENIFVRSTLFITEYFGHDLDTMQNHAKSLVGRILRLLSSSSQALKLELESHVFISTEKVLIPAVHLLDSILRTEIGKEYLIMQRKLGQLAQIAIQFDDAKILSVITKLIVRLLCDPSLCLRVASNFGYLDMFDVLLHSIYSNSSSSASILKSIEENLKLYRKEIVPILVGLLEYSSNQGDPTPNDIEVKKSTILTIGYVSGQDLVDAAFSNTCISISRNLALDLWGILIEIGGDEVDRLLRYIKAKLVKRPTPLNSSIASDTVLLHEILKDCPIDFDENDDEKVTFKFPNESDQEIQFPKSMIMHSSPVFEAMISDRFSEGLGGEIVITDATTKNSWTFLLKWIYISSKKSERQNHQDYINLNLTESKIDLAFTLYTLARKYLLSEFGMAILQWLKDSGKFAAIQGNRAALSYSILKLNDLISENNEDLMQVREYILNCYIKTV